MTNHHTFENRTHHAARMYAREHAAGDIDRREFLTRATALGVTTAGAYALIGLPTPAAAAAHAQEGGTIRMNLETKSLKDPRLWDWSEHGCFGHGWLERMVEYQIDGTLRPMLLESWEANDDATQFTLNVRPGVTWNNGDPFTAEDVARNMTGWCDGTMEGNSMASRMASLIDENTNQVRDGAIEVVDDTTVRLNLNAPDITIIVGMTDYPAVLVHSSYDGGDPAENPIGTGAFLPTQNEVGIKQVLSRNTDHTWWGTEVYGGPYLDTVEYIDYGTDPAAYVAAAQSGEIDATYQTSGDFVDIFDGIGWQKSEAVTANTICIRFNQQQAPYDNVEVRNAIQMAVSNEVILELGYNNLGTLAENHHVAPLHPEYAELPAPVVDPEAALAALEAAGHADTEFELISIDDAYQAASCDAVAAQMRDAGMNITRTVLPGSTFWNDWLNYPFSCTEWNQRPLGVQVLALAYKSGVPWNETAMANPEFDALLAEAMSINDIDARREVMAEIETLMQNEGVMIQPFWRSTFRHQNGEFVGIEMHPSFEHHHYKWARAA